MLYISDYPSGFFNKFSSRLGTREHFQSNVQASIDTIEKGKQHVAGQIRPVSDGSYGFIHPANYPDIITGQPITNFQPFFPSRDFVGSQVMDVTYDSNTVPHSIPYPDITTGTPVGKFNFVNNPPPIGKNLNVSL